MKFLERFTKQKILLGCDIGFAAVKFVRLSHKKDTLAAEAVGVVEACVLDNNVALQRVAAYFKEHGLAGSSANINIEDNSLKIRRMDLAQMPEGDLKIAIRWNFRDYVDGPIEKYIVSYSTMSGIKNGGDKKPVLAFGVASEAVEKAQKVSKQLGLKPMSVEPAATALLAALDHNVGWADGKYHVMIDLGTKITNFAVMGGGMLLFSRPLSGTSIENLLKAVVKEAGIKGEQAEGFFRMFVSNREGDIPKDICDKIKTVVTAFLGQMVIEIQRSIDAFCLMFHIDHVDSIYLCGGGSMIPGVSESLAKNLGVPTQLFNPFEKIDMSGVGGKVLNPQLYAVATGLAMPKA